MRLRWLSSLLLSLALLVLGGPTASAATPAVGTSPAAADLPSVPGTVADGTGYAIPLKGKRPAWFTSALRRKVEAQPGVPVQAPPDAPLPGEVGIRPGSWMLSPNGCTMNFVFRSGSTFGIGSAGHCAKVGQDVTLITLAPGTENPVLVDIGKTVASHNNGIGDDFSLVSIRPALNEWVFPTEAVVAGPCGAYAGAGPEAVFHYGHGLAIGTGGTPRAGLALTWGNDYYAWDGEADFGDSGSAVRVNTGLQAAGDLTHLVVDSKYLPSFIAGTRIGKMLQIAGGWSLVNSGLC